MFRVASLLIGERNRMPVYPGLLALLYDPALSPDAFFERGKQINIILSLVLLAGCTPTDEPTSPTSWTVELGNVRAMRFYERIGARLARKGLCTWVPLLPDP